MTTLKKPATPKTAPEPQPDVKADIKAEEPSEKLKPGYVVFFDAPVFGEEDQVHVGLVIAAKGGRVRVKSLGLAGDSADFPADTLRLSP